MRKLAYILLFISCTLRAQSIDFVLRNNVPVVELEINGKRGLFLIDSGANVSVIDKSFATKAGIMLEPTQNEVKGIGGSSQSYDLVGLRVKHNGENIKIKFIAIEFKNPMQLEGIIGTDFLIKRKVTISFKDSNIY